MPGAEPSRSTHRDSGKQKGSSKTVKSTLWEAFTNNLAVGAERGPNGTWQSTNHKARGSRSQPSGDTASVTSRKSTKSTKSKHSVRSGKSNHSTGTRRNVDNGNGFAGGELPGSVHQDSEGGGGGETGAEGLGEEEEGHGRGEDRDGGEVGGGGKDDGGTEVVGEGQGAGTDENAEHAHAGPGNDDTNERDLSGHGEERRAVEDENAGTGEGAIIDGDGNGEENTRPIIVVRGREMEMSWSLTCIHQLPMHNVLYYMRVRRDKEGERWVV